MSIILDAPHGNAITDVMVGTLQEMLERLGTPPSRVGQEPAVKLVTIEGAGADFCFGSSLEEHVPARMPEVLPRFHALIMDMLAVPAVTCAVVGGRCLGGGFELALACDVIIAADDAVMGLPEIGVGAFPPAASILLPLKVGAARASAAILDGRPRLAHEWESAGLVELLVSRRELAGAADRWFATTIARYSAAALAHAALASRLVVRQAVESLLPKAERLYLQEVLATVDAAEGVAAFLEKRTPNWTDS